MTNPIRGLSRMPEFGFLPAADSEAAGLPLSFARRVPGVCCVVCVLCSMVLAQGHCEGTATPQENSDAAAVEYVGAPVEVDGRPVLMVYAQIGGFTPQERADSIHQRIIALGKQGGITLESIRVQDRGTWTEILAGNDRIMGITDADSKAADRKRPDLAAEYTEIIRHVVKQYREDHTWQHFLRGLLYAVLVTAGTTGLLVVLFLIRRRARSRVEGWLARPDAGPQSPSFGSWMRIYLGRPLAAIFQIVFWIVVLAVVQACVTLALRFFPATRYTSYQITNWLFSELGAFGKLLIGYIPNLVLISFVCLATLYLIKLNEYIFGELRDQRLTIHGFYPDWAEPTAKLVRVLILAAAAVVAFPYLPGSNSPAFKGISVFLGVLLSLGSTSAVAHGVAGTILTYMRAFQVGDFVRIGSDVGEVVEKTLLVTRICTQKKEVVTIPNGTVLSGVVVNYSAEAKQKGVIFHTTVTIGYNAPWRQVHDLLISAALATEDVLHDPRPFVLQTALNDFYVAYELNAYTDRPRHMQNVYSALHENIQDKFNGAGVEINSPHYTSLRDGNRVTIPDNYLPSDYRSPVFEIQELSGLQTRQPPDVVRARETRSA